MKQITILLLFTLSMYANKTFGQYTNNVTLNTQISTSSQNVTGIMSSAVTQSGKTYVAYYDGYFKLKLQLLDANGNKVFGNPGISLDSAVTSYSLASTTDILIDSNENAIVAFGNWVDGNIKIFVVSPSGVILDMLTCGTGMVPKLEMLPSEEFILAFSVGDSSTVKKLSYTVSTINTIWTKSINYNCQEIKALPNGNFYIVSYSNTSPGYAYTHANLIDVTNGNELWSTWKMCSSNMNSAIYTAPISCSIDNDTNLYISNTYFDSGVTRRAYVQKINYSGAILWGMDGIALINDGLFNYQERIYTLFNNSTNELICFINGTGKIGFQKINQSGTIPLSVSGVELVAASNNAQLFGIRFCDNDVVFSYFSEINYYIYASKINLTGSFLWTTILNSTSNSKSWVDANIGAVINDQIIVTFKEDRSGNPQAFAQKADCDGLLPTNITDSKNELGAIHIYPNPAKDLIYFDYRLPQNIAQATINIYNSAGMLSQSFIVDTNDGSSTQNISGLANGIYTLSVVSNNTIIANQKLVICK